MATRASIKFSDNNGNFIANVYHHYDGYPEYLGKKLVELTSAPITNGISIPRPVLGEVFNGMGCLVASVIAKLKDAPGMVYLHFEEKFGDYGEDYLYEVIENSEGTGVKVFVQNLDGELEFVEEILERVGN